MRWDRGFLDGLGRADVFIPLLSIGALEPMAALCRRADEPVDHRARPAPVMQFSFWSSLVDHRIIAGDYE